MLLNFYRGYPLEVKSNWRIFEYSLSTEVVSVAY